MTNRKRVIAIALLATLLTCTVIEVSADGGLLQFVWHLIPGEGNVKMQDPIFVNFFEWEEDASPGTTINHDVSIINRGPIPYHVPLRIKIEDLDTGEWIYDSDRSGPFNDVAVAFIQIIDPQTDQWLSASDNLRDEREDMRWSVGKTIEPAEVFLVRITLRFAFDGPLHAYKVTLEHGIINPELAPTEAYG